MIVSIMVMAGSTTWQGTQAPALVTQAASELVLRTHVSGSKRPNFARLTKGLDKGSEWEAV